MDDSNVAALPPGVDPTKPSPGRLYDLYLGGDQWLPVDREAAERIHASVPEIHEMAWGNRGFLQRAARRLAQLGVRQFIDIGAGLPTRNNTHQAVHPIAPDARVVYVDNDPMIVEHSLQLLGTTPGVCYITGDLRDPKEILQHEQLLSAIDFEEPVAYLMVALFHFVGDHSDPHGLLRTYLDAVPSGSYLALSHITSDGQDPQQVQAFLDVYANATEQGYFRTKDEVTGLFDGLELLPPYEGAEPGLAHAGVWGASDPSQADVSGTWLHCGVARKP